MRLVATRLHPHRLPLVSAWRSAAGGMTERTGWLVELETDDGRRGWGECAPLPSHGSEDYNHAAAALAGWQAALPGLTVAGALAALAAATATTRPSPFTRPATAGTSPASPTSLATLSAFPAPAARAAVECALLDLLAAQQGLPLAAVLRAGIGSCTPGKPSVAGTEPDMRQVRVNAVLGGVQAVEASALTAKAATLAAQGYSVVKLKLGLAAPDDELAALRRLAADLPAGVTLRLDANRAWDEATAARLLAAFAELPVEAVEEPLGRPDLAALRRLQRGLPYPLALDESLAGIDLQTLFADAPLLPPLLPPVRRLVLKLAPLGGLLPAWALAQRAAAAGIECVVTTGVDSACATLAATQLAAALGNPLAHGLATSCWLAADTGAVPTVARGVLSLPATPGLGFVAGAAGVAE